MVRKTGSVLFACMMAGKGMYLGQYTYRASALAFTTLLSLVPMISVSIYMVIHFYVLSDLSILAKDYVIANFLPSVSEGIIIYLDKFSFQASQLPIFSILFLFITTIMLIMTVDNAMRAIWQKPARNKNLISFFIYPLVILLAPILIGLGALLSASLFFLFQYMPAIKIVSFIIPLLINMLMLAVVYLVTANADIKWDDALLGGFIAGSLLELAKFCFALYVNLFSYYEAIYGALAGIPVFFIWLYIFWFIVLYGAFVVSMLSEERKKLTAV